MSRIELKFIPDNFNFLNKKIEFFHLYPKRKISSIYFDTIDLRYYKNSEEGITPRKKIRLRSYNDISDYALEIKYTNPNSRDKFVINNFKFTYYNLKKELLKLNINERLIPLIKVTYLRDYYECKFGRVTLDTKITYQKINNNLNIISNKISDKNNVFELKSNNMNFDKYKFFNFIDMNEIRNSKYCNGINKFKEKLAYK